MVGKIPDVVHGWWGFEIHSTQDVVTLTAALAGLVWVYFNMLRPLAKAVKHGASILMQTGRALGVLDDLPPWMIKHDADRAAIEAELAIVHARVTKIENVQSAMVRDLGVDVRALGVDVRALGTDVRSRRPDGDVDGLSESA